ncbi:MAG: signal recognition particle-docking protein FtsY [Desulfovibrionaceae bacterium]|nr:signal recognition particle-docking protein FtsY [Desulfovibrionaceae bacterium]
MGFFSSIKNFFKSEEKPQKPQEGEELKKEESVSPDTAPESDDTAGSADTHDKGEEVAAKEEPSDKESGADSAISADAETNSPEVLPSGDQDTEAKPEPVTETVPEAESESVAVAAPEPEIIPEPEAEPQADIQTEVHPEPEPESAPEPPAEVQPEPEQVSAPAPAPVEEPQAEAQPEAEVLPAPETETEPVSEPQPAPEEEKAPETEPEAVLKPESESASEPEAETKPEPQEAAAPEAREEKKESGGFLSGLKRFFTGGGKEEKEDKEDKESTAAETEEDKPQAVAVSASKDSSELYQQLMVRLREADSRLSVWLDIVLDGVTEAGPELNDRISFLLRSLEAPANEVEAFVKDFDEWLARMEYRYLDEFRSELQYRLSLALDLEDEEDERSRLFIQLSDSLAKTRAHFARKLDTLISSHGELDDAFWEDLEELFIMADLGVDAAMELTRRLKEKALAEKATTAEATKELLRQEIRNIFVRPKRIVGVNPPEVVLMIGVNGAGKTTTIAKLAYRDRMQGKKVMIAAADTFRAAAIDQMRVWAERVGTLFHAKQPGSDPASVAFEAMDRALAEGVDVLYVDTAGRLQTKVNLMDELSKIRAVLARKHPGSPHRTVLVLDATTGQNALSQAKLFKEAAGVDELILTKLDGTAKGGVAIAVAMQHQLPITYVGMGEKVEDLRPFNGDDYADALFTGSM